LFEGGDPYCGIYALYAAEKELGLKSSLRQMIDPRWIGSRDGSSIEELGDAAKAQGLYAIDLSNLGISSLTDSRAPMILHVLSDSATGKYDHWILYLGSKDGKMRVFDPPRAVRLVEPGELLESWDNNALLISKKPIEKWGLIFESVGTPILLTLAGVAIVSIIARMRSRRGKNLGLWAELMIPVILGALIALIWNSCTSAGMLNRPNAGTQIQAASANSLCPRIGIDSMKSAVKARLATIVDARIPADYAAGHIPGAISIPVSVSAPGFRSSLASIPNDARIIVYCESPNCSFAPIIAGKLVGAGFRNVSLFPGGWAVWEENK
jgi:rhodanese-related sulfurtransferase